MNARRDDDGFTLIELLVVMIIIGILAAIAIPSFLAQRDKGYQAAIKSDLKNAATAQESYATDNEGQYVNADSDADSTLQDNGARISNGVHIVAKTFTVVSGQDGYCLTGTSSRTRAVWYYQPGTRGVVNTKPSGNCS